MCSAIDLLGGASKASSEKSLEILARFRDGITNFLPRLPPTLNPTNGSEFWSALTLGSAFFAS